MKTIDDFTKLITLVRKNYGTLKQVDVVKILDWKPEKVSRYVRSAIKNGWLQNVKGHLYWGARFS
jgi:Mn-dependent DtxR family transcriptional regulator